MESKQKILQIVYIFLLIIFCFAFYSTIAKHTQLEALEVVLGNKNQTTTLETYIVHVSIPFDEDSTSLEEFETYYSSFLPKITSNLNEQSRIVHQYRHVMTGFAARLNLHEVKEMEKKDGFISATPQKILSLHTTHSPAFLGLQQNSGLWEATNYGEGVIIGIVDTGITPDHPSFNDEDISPPPSKWRGKCELYGSFTCNNKLIGAKNFIDVSSSPIDEGGHGTHTSSIAAGNVVNFANVFDQANGTAIGIAPRAHLAMYKVCDLSGCYDSAILAAMDAAIEDGVDVLSLSLGGDPIPFYSDSIALGAFGAIRKGIFVSCSAGNAGPKKSSLANGAPWILTVGASTINRDIRATAVLGNGEEFDGESLYQPKDFLSTFLPLIYPGMNNQTTAFCDEGSLINIDVKGKVVVCQRRGGGRTVEVGKYVKDVGGAAMFLLNDEVDGYSTYSDAHVLPASHLSHAAGQKIVSYIYSTSKPTATIVFEGTIIGVKDAPTVASFSSRGPNQISPGILKPDIVGPGVSILAGWHLSVENKTNSKSNFNIISGTSMSCPHLSGVAALLRSAHPDWSPAAIKSAIMTTANTLNIIEDPIVDERELIADLFAVGAGHVNPSKANNPGLVYDIKTDDYISYLCGLGYTDQQITRIVRRNFTCLEVSEIAEAQLNYPSFSIKLARGMNKTYSRTVTNVGEANSTYIIGISIGLPLYISVSPMELSFTEVKQELSYQINFRRGDDAIHSTFVEGAIYWNSEKYAVRSPIVVELESGAEGGPPQILFFSMLILSVSLLQLFYEMQII